MAIIVEHGFRTTLSDGTQTKKLIGRADDKGDLSAVKYAGIGVVGTQIGQEWWLVANSSLDDDFEHVGPYTQEAISVLINLLPLTK